MQNYSNKLELKFVEFWQKFYKTSQEIYPLEKGFNSRKEFYNLFPLLSYFNLFGTCYLTGIKPILSKF